MRILTESPVAAVEQMGERYETHLRDGSQLASTGVLWATGRTANTQGLGLEAVGVETDESGKIIVDKHYRTSVASVFCLGRFVSPWD